MSETANHIGFLICASITTPNKDVLPHLTTSPLRWVNIHVCR